VTEIKTTEERGTIPALASQLQSKIKFERLGGRAFGAEFGDIDVDVALRLVGGGRESAGLYQTTASPLQFKNTPEESYSSAAIKQYIIDFSELREIRTELAAVRELVVQTEHAIATRPYIVTLSTLAPEPYSLASPVSVALRDHAGCFTADFIEANIGASGETEEQAIRNLKELIVMTFEDLEEEESDLVPSIASQFAILRAILRKNDNA